MKIIDKAIILLFSAVILTACKGSVSTSTMIASTPNPTNVMATAISIAETKIVMTQAATPTVIFLNSTDTPPPGTYSDGLVHPPPADRVEYAMTIAPKIYTLLPYISEVDLLSGEYSGCADTNDFHNFVAYALPLPMETVTAAFAKYFEAENWELTEPTSELIGYEKNIPRTSYEVYRILSKSTPTFERLNVFLTDESLARGKDHIEVRVELSHVETKKHFMDFYCGFGKSWQWTRLHK